MAGRKYRYDIVFSALREEILNGSFEFGVLLPSEREISLRFSVERTTVRKALEMLVEEALVEKKAGLGTKVIYKKTEEAAQNKGRVIGFFITDDKTHSRQITQPYYADLFYHLEQECKAQDCVLIYSTLQPDSDITEILRNYNFVSAVFVTRMEPGYIRQTKKMDIPVLLVNEVHEGAVTISCDHAQGAYLAMRHLLDMGHRNIGIITGLPQYFASEEKLAGCYRALAESGITVPGENIMQGDWEFQSGYDCVRRMFAGRAQDSAPTALFVFNDMMSIGAIRALRDLSLSVPDDVSVIGFDNMGQLRFTEPGLTTVDSNIAYMAELVVNSAASNMFSSCDKGAKVLVPVNLIVRDTVKRVQGSL